eukprot:4103535-Alexandrium_andersonii.AAC.1
MKSQETASKLLRNCLGAGSKLLRNSTFRPKPSSLSDCLLARSNGQRELRAGLPSRCLVPGCAAPSRVLP